VTLLVVEISQLFEVIWVSLLAGIGITTTYSFAVLGTGRSAEARRSGRTGAAIGYGLLATVALIVFAGSFVFAIEIMLTKS
jgi:F0F1-type ATP synthase membrane subunit c/vacuolar-type H+-ATPase subunit K